VRALVARRARRRGRLHALDPEMCGRSGSEAERSAAPAVHNANETFRIAMQTHNIIERAFQLARASDNIDEIRKVLRQEGYSNVDAHLAGASIKADLKKQFVR
jgi:tRNA G26 N,N-dimethylase Trm1